MTTYIDIHKHTERGIVVEVGSSPGTILDYASTVHPCDVSLPELHTISIDNYDSQTIIAIGETGLDYRREYRANVELQRLFFKRYIEVAEKLHKFVVVHQIRALDDTLEILKDATVPVIFHGFSGSLQSAQRIIGAGYYISFGHLLLNNIKLQSVIRNIPLSFIFFETDESPWSIEEIYSKAALILGLNIEDLKAEITKNFNDVIRLADKNRTTPGE